MHTTELVKKESSLEKITLDILRLRQELKANNKKASRHHSKLKLIRYYKIITQELEKDIKVLKQQLPNTVNINKHFKIWFSPDHDTFMPMKNQLRMIKLRNSHPKAELSIVYSSSLLCDKANIEFEAFCTKYSISLIDFDKLNSTSFTDKIMSNTDLEILNLAKMEIEYFKANQGGNLAAASDCARIMYFILEKYGIYSDLDVDICIDKTNRASYNVISPLFCNLRALSLISSRPKTDIDITLKERGLEYKKEILYVKSLLAINNVMGLAFNSRNIDKTQQELLKLHNALISSYHSNFQTIQEDKEERAIFKHIDYITQNKVIYINENFKLHLFESEKKEFTNLTSSQNTQPNKLPLLRKFFHSVLNEKIKQKLDQAELTDEIKTYYAKQAKRHLYHILKESVTLFTGPILLLKLCEKAIFYVQNPEDNALYNKVLLYSLHANSLNNLFRTANVCGPLEQDYFQYDADKKRRMNVGDDSDESWLPIGQEFMHQEENRMNDAAIKIQRFFRK